MPRTDATDETAEAAGQTEAEVVSQAEEMAQASAEQPAAEAVTASPEAAAAEVPSAPQTYVVQSGDSLSAISEKVYGDAKHWDTIYEHNKETIGDDPNVIQPGQELSIP
jgi:nucleoid-associated protein YgaU